MAILPGLLRTIQNMFASDKDTNKWADAFLGSVGGNYTAYDSKGNTYVSEGFQKNSAVYSIIRQRYEKVRSIPYYVKQVEDKAAKVKLDSLIKSTNYDFSPAQKVHFNRLRKKAYREDAMPMPIEKPNPMQTWGEFFATYEMYMCIDGNCYIYVLDGMSKPNQLYILPSHLMAIVVKGKGELSASLKTESPVAGYLLTEGRGHIDFLPEEVVHIKTPNPDFGEDGAHLYGQSPLRAALRSVQSFNEGIDNNNRMMRNSGAYGLIHGKGHRSLSKTQADQIKDRLEAMDKDTSRLGQITGVSAEVGFTRLGLSPQEMKVFEYLNFDEKQLANVLGWDTRLLNQDSGATFDNLKIAEKRVVVATTQPSIEAFAEAFNRQLLPRFSSHKGAILVFDFSELPEMQVDMNQLVTWLSMALDRGVVTRDEFREAIGYDATGEDYMETHTISQFLEPLEEAVMEPLSLQANNIPHDPNALPE